MVRFQKAVITARLATLRYGTSLCRDREVRFRIITFWAQNKPAKLQLLLNKHKFMQTYFLMKPSKRSCSLEASCEPLTMNRSFLKSN